MGALTQLAGIRNHIDYEREGLTVDKMGRSGMRPDEITEYVRNGRRPAP
jgi:hypothetical protein